MTNAPDDSEEREKRLDEVIGAYHEAHDRGEAPSPDEWIARHPDLAPDLEAYFRWDGRMTVVGPGVPRAPDSGTRFGPYRVIRVIGRGGMGVVYEAEDVAAGPRVALKVLPSCILPDPREAERFRREATAVAEFDHPNLLPILALGEHAGIPYFAMPLVDGRDLRAVVRRLRRSRSKATYPVEGPGGPHHLGGPTAEHARAVAAIGLQAAEGLDHAHRRQVVHRDVKPSNLMLDAAGKVFVADFGLAQTPEGNDLSETGDLAGTLRYLPPERFRGWSDPRSDVYSLGLTLYELLTLRPAFDETDRRRLLKAIARDTPRRPRAIDGEIPRDLEQIIRKAIEREPAHRYPSAATLAEDLRRFLEGHPIRARRVNPARRAWSWARHNPLMTTALALSTVILIGVVTGAFWVEHLRRSAAEATAKESLARQQAAEATAKESRARQQAAEAAARESDFQNQLLQIEALRTGEHRDGWSSRVMERAREASGMRRDERLRDQAAASMAGIDAVDRRETLGVGGSSVAFNADGNRLLIGGSHPGTTVDGLARILDVPSNHVMRVSKQPGPGPVTFTKTGKAVQLMPVEGIGLCLWDVETNRPETSLVGPLAETPEVLALSSDGTRAAASIRIEDRPTIRVWDGTTGRVLHDLPSEATALAFSPEGERLAAGNERGEVRIWSPDDGWNSLQLKATSNRVQALSFTRDSRRDAEGNQGWLLAVGDAGAEIAIVEEATSTVRTRCIGSPYEVAALAFSPDGTILASGGRHLSRLWDAAKGTTLLCVGGSDRTSGIAISRQGDQIAFSHRGFGESPSVNVFRLEYGRGIATLLGLTGPISKVVFSTDGRRIAALSHDWRIGVWDLDDDRSFGVLEGPRGLYADNAALAFRSDSRQLAVSSGQSAQLWDLNTCRPHPPWKLPPGLNDALVFDSPSELMLCRFECVDGIHRPDNNDFGRFPRVVQFRNLLASDPLKPTRSLLGYQRLNASAATPDGRMFVLSLIQEGADATRHVVKAIGVTTGETRWSYEYRRPDRNGKLAIDPGGSYVGCERASPDRPYVLLRLESGEEVSTHPHFAFPAQPEAIGPGARLLACLDEPSQGHSVLRLHFADSEIAILRLGIDGKAHPNTTTFDHDGRRVAWGQVNGIVYVCDLEEVHRGLRSAGLE